MKTIQLLILGMGLLFLTSCGTSEINIPPPDSTRNIPPVKVIEDTGSVISTGELVPNSSGAVTQISTGIIDTISGEAALSDPSDICLFNLCIHTKKPYFEIGDEYLQAAYLTGEYQDTWEYETILPKQDKDGWYENLKETERIIRVKKDKSSGSLEKHEVMSLQTTSIYRVSSGTFFVKNKSGGCGGTSFQEHFIDSTGNRISFESFDQPYPRTIQIGQVPFSNYWTDDFVSFAWRLVDNKGVKQIENTISVHDDVNAVITKQVLTDKEFFHAYAIEFKEYPNIVFLYQSAYSNADRIVQLGTDKKWLSTNLDTKGNLLDFSLTKKILGYYQSNNGNSPIISNRQIRAKGDINFDGITPENITTSMLPVFRVVSLDTNGNYLLYTADAYESVTMAELCKPLVYIYDTFNRANTLTISLPQGGIFTKIIPDFSYGNTWNFRANSNSQITTDTSTTKSNFLYYSVKVPNYQYNTTGWQVLGKDIGAFFEEKLDTIGLNTTEKKDFIEYWIPEFDPNTPYFVSFKFDESINPYAVLKFQKEPTSSIRVLLEAYPINNVTPQFQWPNVGKKFDSALLRHFSRSGVYDVLEWGGTVQKIPGGTIHIH